MPVDFVTRAEGRIPINVFARELLRDERKVVGLYDATITATDPFPDRESFGGPDPTLSGIGPAYTIAINRQLRSEIGVETDREYTLLSYEVNAGLEGRRQAPLLRPPDGATDDFRYGMSLNPHMKAFITHGRFDLVTPYYASDRLRNLMRLDPAMAGRAHRPPLRRRPHVLRVGRRAAGPSPPRSPSSSPTRRRASRLCARRRGARPSSR